MLFWVRAMLLGLFAGVLGTASGGLFSFLLWKPRRRLLSLLLGLSAGIMLVIIFMELLSESVSIGGLWMGLIGLTSGILLLYCLDLYFPHQHFTVEEGQKSRLRQAGILLGIGIALHNVPEGLAIGSSYYADAGFGLDIAIIMALHNVPEGIAMATTMKMGGFRNLTIILATVVAGLPMAFGGAAGALVGSISPTFLSISLAFAAGAMLYIVCDELIPEAHKSSEGHSATLGVVFGVIAGMFILSIQ